tara:strand:+ start:4377 stop:6059 length:1683 start_codon:yes stop_codon:yes gene_type:complete
MKKFQVLDCTLRDGGYYTDWSFDKDLVRRMVKALDGNKVDIIELGYKSPVKGGPYRKCNDGFIRSIIDFELNHSKFSFMIDAKDYFLEQSIDLQLLRDIIKPKFESPFEVCRVALKFSEIEQSMELIGYIQNLGYQVFVNLMQTSILEDSNIKYFNKRMKEFGVEKTYIADSFGALLPLQVGQIFTNHDVDGIHTHDNMNLAFANCVTAIDNGATWCDGTITGMGRGVGNVYTEQLLQWRGEITNDMLDVVDEFQQMKLKHGWGHNPLYMYSGLNHIHPLYVQDLNQSNLNGSQLFTAASKLKNTHSYDSKLLVELKEQRAVVIIPARYKSSRFPGKPLAKINGKEMILHVCEKAEQAVGIENVYVATENEEIAKVVRGNGYSVVITSDNCLTGTDRVAEASQEIDADIFVNVQGDEPVINPEDILKVIEAKKNNPDSIVNCFSKLHQDEDPADRKIPKVIMDLDNNLLYSSRAPLPSQKELNKDNLIDIYKQVCIYAFNKEHLQKFTQESKTPLEREEDIEINRFLEKGINVKMLRSDHVSYAVDYPEDINVIEKMSKV